MRKSGLVLSMLLVWFAAVGNATGDESGVRYIAPGLAINDNNNNVPVGWASPGYKVLMSFRAVQSGDLTGFRTYFQSAPGGGGYSSGTCGTIRIRVWPSDGATPPMPDRTGTALSEGQITFNCVNATIPFEQEWPLISLTPASSLTANQLYFIEIANIDPSPYTNWISVNARCALTVHTTADPHHNNSADWAMYWDNGSITNLSTGTHPSLYGGLYHFPNAEMCYSNGTCQGGIRLEPGNYGGYMFSVNSSTQVRERFNIQETLQITGVEIHTSASTAGSLSVSFIKNDVTQATGTITENPANYYTTGPNTNGVYSWHTVDLNTTDYFTVNNGDVLDIKMTAIGSAVFMMSADRTGNGASAQLNSVSDVALYRYSSAQYWNGSSWVNTLYYNKNCSSCRFATSHFRVILKDGSTPGIFSLAEPTGLRVIE